MDRRFVFGEEAKRFFSSWMRRGEEFRGVKVATWCLMSNHFVAACGDDREFGFANH